MHGGVGVRQRSPDTATSIWQSMPEIPDVAYVVLGISNFNAWGGYARALPTALEVEKSCYPPEPDE